MNSRTAVLLGSSGMVGGFCLTALLESPDYGRVVVMARRAFPVPSDPKVTLKVVDFDHLSAADFAGANDLFCALGTTIRKAGTQEAFRRVDLEYPLAAAKHGLRAGATQFLLVSSAGADAASKNFYLHTKGELEQKLGELGYRALKIFRPGLLLGKREEVRPGERFASRIAPFINFTLWGPLRHYRSIAAETVGRAMVGAATQDQSGTSFYEYDQISKLAEAFSSQHSASSS
ncbi:MAG: oxidoreductase [Acidobacteriia bacterium]|nr:oxidoreductase [Terriglobia bacterium]